MNCLTDYGCAKIWFWGGKNTNEQFAWKIY